MRETPRPESYSKPKILVVDDEKRIREGCRLVLSEEGYEVALAETGDLGLKMIEEEHFDIILLDLMMPGLSGFDVLSHVKALHPDTVVIVITGYATVEHSIEAMKNGAFDFIPKPYSPAQLRVVVSKAIDYTRALKDIAEEKSRMRVLIDLLANGVMVTDTEKRLVLVNPAFLKMVDCKENPAVGWPIKDFVQNELLNEMIEKALSMPEDSFAEQTEELQKGAKGEDDASNFHARCVPFRDRVGRTLGTITVLNDITYLKKIDQLKSDFVSMVAHEIRSPLNSVLAQLKIMRDGLAGDVTEKQHEIMSRASEKIASLVNLSSELLSLAKKEAGLTTLERSNCDMAAIIEDQVSFHLPKAQEKEIQIELTVLPELPPIFANRHNMEEVLSNLISNAIHYTPEGGRIEVSACVEDPYLCISVSDTGYGIAAEDLDRIFDRFYRVKNEKTRYIIGTGLGLPIVKSIVEAHNGRIRVESKPDSGSTFFVYIPLTRV
ncbi:MAG: response regulator [Deltaproteobacteria bacterium]|nr:response regulator [Deltaproteobacteria bacterium]